VFAGQSGDVYSQQYASIRAQRPEFSAPGYPGVATQRTPWLQSRQTPATAIATVSEKRDAGFFPTFNRVTSRGDFNYLAAPLSSIASSDINYCPSAPQDLAFFATPSPQLQPTSTIASYRYPFQVNNRMSEHEVSRLERSPDALRTADIPTDPELENHPPHEHVHHQDQLPIHHHIPHHPDAQQFAEHLQHPDHMQHHDHHEEIHDDMSSPDAQEPFSPRRGYTHKRNEDPPRNALGKMICKFQATCSNLTFDRRCEWRLVFSCPFKTCFRPMLTFRQ
jgi:hypothetical protein